MIIQYGHFVNDVLEDSRICMLVMPVWPRIRKLRGDLAELPTLVYNDGFSCNHDICVKHYRKLGVMVDLIPIMILV